MHDHSFLLYGATGYTGKLIARYARDYDLAPLLCGRTEASLKELASTLQLPYLVIDINDHSALVKALSTVKLVINAAGPFVNTAPQMIHACLEAGTHYVDINGDINVFESIKNFETEARGKRIMLLPGAGFDVVPTDCMALHLKKRMPDAVTLKLAFASVNGGVSHGTAMTMTTKLGQGGAEREQGKIVKEPLGDKGMWVDFGEKRLFVISIPWGDVATAYYTTAIPNITAYTAMRPGVYRLLKFQSLFNWLLRTAWLKNIIRKKIKSRPAGPDDESRRNAKSLVWGEVSNAKHEVISASYSCADGYTLTAHSCLVIAKKILAGDFKIGFQTPASCYGENLVDEMPGTVWRH